MTNPLDPGYRRLDGRQHPAGGRATTPITSSALYPFHRSMPASSVPERLAPMEGETFPQIVPPPPEPIRVEELDPKAQERQSLKVLNQVRDKVEGKSKHMRNVFRQVRTCARTRTRAGPPAPRPPSAAPRPQQQRHAG